MTKPKRSIRSFVIRAGRITTAQRRALEELWPQYGLNAEGAPLDAGAEFGNANPLVIEIGFGMGDSLVQMAADNPSMNFVGIEVHRPGLGHVLRLAQERGITNLRVYCADTIGVLENCITPGSVDRVQIFFPDPWPKKRHHKRRLLNADFVTLLESRLASGGIVHIATDWQPYGEGIQGLMSAYESLIPVEPPSRPLTKYELRGKKLGHDLFELAFRKRAGYPPSSTSR